MVPETDVNPDSGGVAAVVLTYDARHALERLLARIAAQSTAVDLVLVTDNASPRPVDDIVARSSNVRLTRLPENLGPAGGYAAALQEFLESGCEWAWVLDDDCVPSDDALAQQLAIADAHRVVLATVRWAETGQTVRGHGWWGALIPRAVVERVGVPNAELFWWTEDTEYLQWRIPHAGYDVVWTDEPVIEVSRARDDASKPAWKYYYEARNQVYHRLYVQRPTGDEARIKPRPRHLQLRVRAGRAARSVGKLAVRATFREHDQRWSKLVMVARGTSDGLRRRLGRSVAVDRADRPSAATTPTIPTTPTTPSDVAS
jgi:glycosyltransferase involved in cell wall biosynthesis